MIALILPLIVTILANQCPYCKWNACTISIGSLPNCSACYDVAALVPIFINHTQTSPTVGPLGVCQLCPGHCASCEYALAEPSFAPPIPIINCTSCAVGYTTNHFTGKCDSCPSNCGSCSFAVVSVSHSMPYGVINCTSCDPQFTNNYFSGQCLPCPENCLECACSGGKGCPYVTCTSCESGYYSNVTETGATGCFPNVTRLLVEEENFRL